MVELAMRYHCVTTSEPWINAVPAIQYEFNVMPRRALNGHSPDEVLMGFKPRTAIDLLAGNEQQNPDWTPEHFATLRSLYQQEARDMMGHLRARMVDNAEDGFEDLEFMEGQKVMLRLHSGYSLPGEQNRKFSRQRVGPFVIQKKINRNAYQISFPANWKIHNVVSVRQLVPYPGDDPFGRRSPAPGPIWVEGDDDEWKSYEIERLVQKRKTKTGAIEYLVRWKGYGPQDDMWYRREVLMENASDMVEEFDAQSTKQNKGPHIQKRGPGRPPKRKT